MEEDEFIKELKLTDELDKLELKEALSTVNLFLRKEQNDFGNLKTSIQFIFYIVENEIKITDLEIRTIIRNLRKFNLYK